MQKFFRDNQKKMLAIFGVLLMISFVATLGPKGTSPVSADVFIGHVGSDKVSREDVARVENEWKLLTSHIVYRAPNGIPGQSDWQPISIVLVQHMIPDMQTAYQVHQLFSSKPEALYLLQYEAKKVGLTPQLEEADSLFENAPIAIQLADGSKVPLKDVRDRSLQAAAREAMANILMVQSGFVQAIDLVKVSTPMIRHDLSRQYQEVKVRVVDFATKDYESKVATPTGEQLQKQFDHYADLEAGSPGATNPFGFGYKHPDRLKVQYIAIPRAEVRKSVQSKQDDYSWDVEVNRYYIQHVSEFPATQPATTGPTTSLGLGAAFAPQGGPTTKPIAEVRQQIMDKLIEPRVDRIQQQIQSELVARLNQDYDAWQLTHPTTAPSTGPVSEFMTFEYLQKLADGVRKTYNVTLTVASVADSFKTAAELHEVSGFGKVPNLVEYLMAAAEPFMPDNLKKSPQALKLFKAARPMSDDARDIYISRIVAADPAHRPANLDEVKDQVERDWKKSQEFDMAKADAQKLLEAARTGGQGLVAPAIGDHTVITTGAYPASDSFPIDNYKLSAAAQADFVRQTFDLLAMINTDKHPMSVVDLPSEGKVGVTELIYVESSLRPETIDRFASIYSDQVVRQYQMALASNWFNPTSIIQRVGYVDDTPKRNTGDSSQDD